MLSSSSISLAAYETQSARRHWQFAEVSDETGILCRASTVQTNSTVPLELSVTYPKNGTSLPRIEIRTKLQTNLIAVATPEGAREGMFPLKAAGSPEEEVIFWYAPQNFIKLETFIREKNTLSLVIDPKGLNQIVQVSLAGSANALDGVQNCRKGALSPQTFLALLAKREDLLNPDLGDKSVSLMKQSTELAFEAYQKGLSIQDALALIRKPFASDLRREEAAKVDLAAKQRTATDRDSKLAEAQRIAVNAEQKLNGARSELVSLQNEKELADQNLAAKRAIYLPLKAQIDGADRKVSDARRVVDNTQREISQSEAIVSRNQQQIRNLENERTNLRRSLPQEREDVVRLRRVYDEAESNFRRYDVRWETDRALNRDSSYQMAKWDYERAQQEAQQARWNLDRATSAWQMAVQSLDRCRMQPNGPNCASEEAEVARWERERSMANSQLTQAQQAQNWAESRMRDRQWAIQSEIQRNSDRLRAIRDNAESEYVRAANTVDRSENRLQEIEVALPRLRAELDRASERLPGLRAQLASQQAILNQAVSERQALAERIGFAEAENSFLEAGRKVDTLNKGIQSKNTEIAGLVRALDRAQKAIPPLERAAASARVELVKAQTTLASVQERLKPLREKEAPLLTELAGENGKYQLNKELFFDLVDLYSQDLR
jgi:chromosome segregation ATPase